MENPKQNNNLKSWAEDDLPREKLLQKGKESLSNSELVAILLGSGSRDETAVHLAKRILDSCQNNLFELSKLGIAKLKKFKGVGTVKAITIEAALELGRRRQHAAAIAKPQIISAQDCYEILKSSLEDLHHEEMWLMLLNHANKLIRIDNVSIGGSSQTVVDAKIIFRKALEANASKIVIAHNHPSGILKPSQQDIEITHHIFTSGKHIGIPLLDHLIISEEGFYSFLEENKLMPT